MKVGDRVIYKSGTWRAIAICKVGSLSDWWVFLVTEGPVETWPHWPFMYAAESDWDIDEGSEVAR